MKDLVALYLVTTIILLFSLASTNSLKGKTNFDTIVVIIKTLGWPFLLAWIFIEFAILLWFTKRK